MSNFYKIVKDVCNKNKIKFTLLSEGWVIRLEKDNKVRFIIGHKFDLNTHAIGEIIDDKYIMYDVLKNSNIPVIEHHLLYPESNKHKYAIGFNNRENITKFLLDNKKVVVKSNTGTCGMEVYKIEELSELNKVLDSLLSKHFSISYCPYYEIQNEYRIIVLNKKIVLMYKKIRPIVIGNGCDTIRELLMKFNSSYFKNKLKDKIYDKVLPENEKYEYNWKFNLSRGAIVSFDIENKINIKLKNIVNQVLDTININFASIDIAQVDKEFLVLEINSGVMMNNLYNIIDDKHIVENIYEEAILTMFKND